MKTTFKMINENWERKCFSTFPIMQYCTWNQEWILTKNSKNPRDGTVNREINNSFFSYCIFHWMERNSCMIESLEKVLEIHVCIVERPWLKLRKGTRFGNYSIGVYIIFVCVCMHVTSEWKVTEYWRPKLSGITGTRH